MFLQEMLMPEHDKDAEYQTWQAFLYRKALVTVSLVVHFPMMRTGQLCRQISKLQQNSIQN